MPNALTEPLRVYNLGVVEYGAAWRIQQQLHASCVAEHIGPSLLVVEHPDVITLGKHADSSDMLVADALFKRQGVKVFHIDRGGQVTAHMPGQLVVYPILNLSSCGLSAKSYVQKLEQAVIDTLATLGIAANTDAEYPGVWVGSSKICAVGVRIKQRVSMHGIALNVVNDLSLFGKIIPCGIRGRGVTSIAQLGVFGISVTDMATRLVPRIAQALGLHAIPASLTSVLQSPSEDLMITP